jgi:hypothetical protein
MRRNPGYRVLSLLATHCSRGPCSSDSEQNKNQIQEYTWRIQQTRQSKKESIQESKNPCTSNLCFFSSKLRESAVSRNQGISSFPIPPCETKSVLVSYVLIPSSPRIVHSQELSKSENKMRAGSGDIKRTARIQGTRPEGAYRHRSIREIELENQNTQPKMKKNRGWRIRPGTHKKKTSKRTHDDALVGFHKTRRWSRNGQNTKYTRAENKHPFPSAHYFRSAGTRYIVVCTYLPTYLPTMFYSFFIQYFFN